MPKINSPFKNLVASFFYLYICCFSLRDMQQEHMQTKPRLKICKDHLGLWKKDSTNTSSNGSWPVVSVSLLPFQSSFFYWRRNVLGSWREQCAPNRLDFAYKRSYWAASSIYVCRRIQSRFMLHLKPEFPPERTGYCQKHKKPTCLKIHSVTRDLVTPSSKNLCSPAISPFLNVLVCIRFKHQLKQKIWNNYKHMTKASR